MNPHLAILAILSAGLIGFEADSKLTVLDPKKIMLKNLEGKEAEEHGFKDRMPRTLKLAITKLKEDGPLLEALGPEIMEKYLKLKTKEEENFSKLTGAERRAISMRFF